MYELQFVMHPAREWVSHFLERYLLLATQEVVKHFLNKWIGHLGGNEWSI
jgi:hypothetical protein